MNRYEMGVVVRADLEPDVFQEEMEKVKGFIARFGGTIDKIDEWGRRKLAYPIAKQTEGVYTFITYSAEGNTVKDVESRLRLMETILRFLTIRMDENEPLSPATPPQTAEPTAKPEPTTESEAATETATETPAE